MAADTWNPVQYDRFKRERSQPFYDLIELLRPVAGARVVDLGCGTGELTGVLHERINAKETLGIDSSPSMLAKAPASSHVRFQLGDIATFNEGGWDVVLSNAALHWLPDHPALFERLTKLLSPGGQLAVQMPANNDHPTHVVAHALAKEAPYASALSGYERQWPVLAPEAYASLLFGLGYAQQHVRLEQSPEKDTLELRGRVVAKQRCGADGLAEKGALRVRIDLEAQISVREAVPAIEPELVHAGDDGEARLDGLVAAEVPARVPEIIARLHHRRSVVAFAVLRLVQAALHVLELADHLRDFGPTRAEHADAEIRLAAIAGLARSGDRKFGVEIERLSALPVFAIAPCFNKEAGHEGSLCLGFALQLAGTPVGQPLLEDSVLAAPLVIHEFVVQHALQELSIEKRLEAIDAHWPRTLGPSAGYAHLLTEISRRPTRRPLNPLYSFMPMRNPLRNCGNGHGRSGKAARV